MNIVQLASNKVWGGGERYVLDLCKALRADGHTVRVYTRNIPAVRDIFGGQGLLAGTMRMGGVWDVLTPVRLASRLGRLDGRVVVHVHNFKDAYTALAARRMARNRENIKVVATRHLVKAAKTDPHHLRTLAELDAIIFVSQLALDEFLKSGPKIDRSRLHVVHNGIMAGDCGPRAEAAGDAPVKLIFAGRIVPEKGVDVLVKALEKIKDLDWRLEVCGTGSSRDVMPVVRLARGLDVNDRIDWSGHCEDVPERMARADVGVFPSVCRESFGLTILEAFSRRLPVVTTNNGAQREIVEDGRSGLLVPPADADALAAALRRLIADADLRRSMGDEGYRRYVDAFGYDKFYNSILNIYNGC